MRLRGGTLRARVVRSTALVSAVAMAAMIAAVFLVLSAVSNSSLDARLNDQVVAVTATLDVQPDGTLVELGPPVDVIDDTTWVFERGGRLVLGPRVTGDRLKTAESLARVTARVTVVHRGRRYLAVPVRTAGARRTNAVVVVAASLEPYEETRTAVLLGLSTLGIMVTIGSAALAAWALRRALVPVQAMAAMAEDWSQHDLEARFDVTRTDDEIAQLGRTLNLLLDQVAGALQSEQRLTSELAHELRTPLTAIKGEAELGRMATREPDSVERYDRVVALVDRMTTTIGTLVALARGQRNAVARTKVADLVAAAASARPTDPRLSTTLPELPDVFVAAPVDLAVRALSPLLDNALHHARESVVVSAAVHARTVDVTVSDDGAGIADTDLDALFAAGNRGTSSSGAGLGLALARRVARTLGGDVHLTSPQAPTSFTLRLPRL